MLAILAFGRIRVELFLRVFFCWACQVIVQIIIWALARKENLADQILLISPNVSSSPQGQMIILDPAGFSQWPGLCAYLVLTPSSTNHSLSKYLLMENNPNQDTWFGLENLIHSTDICRKRSDIGWPILRSFDFGGYFDCKYCVKWN